MSNLEFDTETQNRLNETRKYGNGQQAKIGKYKTNLLHPEVHYGHKARRETRSNAILSEVPGYLEDVALALVALDERAVLHAPDVQVPSERPAHQVVT